MKLLRMSPGHGDILLAEGDPEVSEDTERLVAEFRRQLELGMWAAVPTAAGAGRREATMVRDFSEVPADAERVIFFPPAAGGGSRGGELLAEGRALELLREVAGEEAESQYRQLGFVAVPGGDDGYGYLIYPQRPIVAYDAASSEPLNEYCVLFRDGAEPGEGARLPDADDVLAKWMALNGDERGLIGRANMDPPGRQLDPEMVRRDLEALRRWRGRDVAGREPRGARDMRTS